MNNKRLAWPAALSGLGVLSAVLYLFGIAGGARSEYYAAIAMSMSKSFSNFFYGAIDPAGTITLDKIPGSYWMPAIFVKLFGFSTWAIEAPNGLAAVGTVLIVAITVRRLAGDKAGIIAGVLVASTPIIAAVARANQPEMPFLLMLSAVFYFAVRAFETGSLRQLIYAGLFIAAGFNMYMIEAWAIWPALALAWLLTKGKPMVKKLIDLVITGSISIATSLIWILIVWAIPAGSRPYIGSTIYNSPWEMVFGYDALGRFNDVDGSHKAATSTAAAAFRTFTPPFSGSPSLVRLFNHQVAPEISWLLIAAGIAAVILFVSKQHRLTTIFLVSWLGVFSVMFSVVSGMHQFYTSSLALPMAGLISLAIITALEQGKAWMTLLIAAPTVAWAVWLTIDYDYLGWTPIVAVLALAALIYAVRRKVATSVIVGLTVLSIAFTPAAWAVDAMSNSNAINPVAGPMSLVMNNGGGAMHGGPGAPNFAGGRPNFGRGQQPNFGSGQQPNFSGGMPNFAPGQQPNFAGGAPNFAGSKAPAFGQGPSGITFGAQSHASVVKYLQAHRGKAKYLLVTFGAQAAASYITETGDNILPIGGFNGNDPAPTLVAFRKLVAEGQVKYVLVDTTTNAGPNGSASSSESGLIQVWVTAYCQLDGSAPAGTNLYVCDPKTL
jgi:4-amino-4-deoxy-L-arabinose transferase-like glycosyltransferase